MESNSESGLMIYNKSVMESPHKSKTDLIRFRMNTIQHYHGNLR